ncbi:MAG: asparagine synthetase B, partial [Deltaproteobacteria bacterium]|nr:asparagine synthetase B [Deltaproteobacteria bacterium]
MWSADAVDVDLVATMITAQTPRGPDAHGVVSGPPGLAMGHARLAIVDESAAGNQPFAKRGAVLSYNGEIYNHMELRPELARMGAEFQGTSDTATLFEALRLL